MSPAEVFERAPGYQTCLGQKIGPNGREAWLRVDAGGVIHEGKDATAHANGRDLGRAIEDRMKADDGDSYRLTFVYATTFPPRSSLPVEFAADARVTRVHAVVYGPN
jgi:hypothetical protein